MFDTCNHDKVVGSFRDLLESSLGGWTYLRRLTHSSEAGPDVRASIVQLEIFNAMPAASCHYPWGVHSGADNFSLLNDNRIFPSIRAQHSFFWQEENLTHHVVRGWPQNVVNGSKGVDYSMLGMGSRSNSPYQMSLASTHLSIAWSHSM